MDGLREFLVSIGYDVGSPKNWNAAIGRAETLAKEIQRRFDDLAGHMRRLFVETTMALDVANWSASKAGTSASNLRALTYAMQQTGQSSGAASAVLGSFAATLRTLPSAESIIRGLGVRVRVDGAVRDQQEILLDVIDALNRDPNYVQAAATAGYLGISERDYAHFRRVGGDIRRLISENKDAAGAMGLDRDALGVQSTAAMHGWRSAMMRISIAVDVLVVAITPALTRVVDDLNRWISTHEEDISSFLTKVVEAFAGIVAAMGRLIERFAPADDLLSDIMGRGSELKESIGTFAATGLALIAARMMLFGGKVKGGFAALVAAFVVGKYVAPAFVDGGSSPGEGEGKRGFWGRLSDRVGGALGLGGRGSSPGGVSSPQGDGTAVSGPPLDRTTFAEELKDPKVRERLMALTEAEVGSQGGDAQQAFMETIFNRAKARGQSLWQTMQGPYFPAVTHSRAGAMAGDPRLEAKYKAMFDRVYGGSNISNGATGNASGSVGFGGGPETKRFGGEKFGVERRDLRWWQHLQEEQAQRARDDAAREEAARRLRSIREQRAPRDDLAPGPTSYLIDDLDGMSVTTDRRTKIVVHGDPEPHKTTVAIGTEQKRINADMIVSTERAFA